jgi:hypothetical protein
MQNSKITIHDLTTNAPADIHISAGVNGLFVHPEGTGTHDGDCYAPILLEIIDGKPFLYVYADINQIDFTHRIDLSTALESNRNPNA